MLWRARVCFVFHSSECNFVGRNVKAKALASNELLTKTLKFTLLQNVYAMDGCISITHISTGYSMQKSNDTDGCTTFSLFVSQYLPLQRQIELRARCLFVASHLLAHWNGQITNN